MLDLLAGDDRGRPDGKNAGADQSLVGAQSQHQTGHRGVLDGALILLAAGEQAGRAHRLVALVDADQKFGRAAPALDRGELHALDLPRNGAELARWIDLGFDAAAGILFHCGGEALEPLVLGVVDRGGGELHGDGSGTLCGGGRCQRQERSDTGNNDGGPAVPNSLLSSHDFPLPLCAARIVPDLGRPINGQRATATWLQRQVSAAMKCVTWGAPASENLCTASCTRRSALVTRSCWRKCSIQDSTRKISRIRPSSAASSYTPQRYAPSRRRSGSSLAIASRNASR